MSLKDNSYSESDSAINLDHASLFEHIVNKFATFNEEGSDSWLNLINETQLINLPAQTEIMQPDSPCEQFMIILNGSVRVFQHTEDDREITLYRLNPGDVCVLSINGLLKCNPYSAYACAESNVDALVFSRVQFFEAMGISEGFRNYILTSISDRFNDMLDLIETTAFDNLENRLVCMLSKMSQASKTDTIHITHYELGRELGTSREVISRVLKGLEKKGCLSLARGTIQIKM